MTPELLEGPYFCREEKDTFFEWARPAEGNATLERFRALAKELGVVIIVGALTFFPALSLGPVVEHLLMHAGTTF